MRLKKNCSPASHQPDFMIEHPDPSPEVKLRQQLLVLGQVILDELRAKEAIHGLNSNDCII